ncbi:hypothetical protein [Neobacillus dielmonensis]|uniref:hypothetical protein n=1 Tax=Neobacillus dielmonensis TaxID=1347369 RepID=UPI0005A78628|nr:hypothetical protein [Neobacillus dielmonensis]
MKYFIVFTVIISIFIAGCSKEIGAEEQLIKVQKRMGDENVYEDFKVIKKNEQVQKVREIVDHIDWTNAQVSMVRPADYRFAFQSKKPGTEGKVVLYELWISPNKDRVELVLDAEGKYVQLNKKKSAELFESLTDGELGRLSEKAG